MTIRSLRSKILLLLTSTLLVIAVFIVLISRHEVTKALSETERHAMGNALTLAERNLKASWDSWLDDKIFMVRNERTRLMETGELIFSVLSDDNRRATGDDDTGWEQRLGADWINRLPADPLRHVFAYDAQFKIRVSSRPGWVGQDISALRDFKGQPLAQSMYDESRRFKYGFAMYRAGDKADDPAYKTRMHYGYFVYFKNWDWVVVIAVDGQGMAEQIASQNVRMEDELQESLGTMRLARSGFMFAVADDGHFVASPSGDHKKLMDAAFLERLRARSASDRHDGAGGDGNFDAAARFRFDTQAGGELWHVEYHYFKPLGWTLAAMVPDRDLLLPAQDLIERQLIVFAVILFCAWAVAFLVIARIVAPLSLLARFAHRLPEQDWTAEENKVPAPIAILPERFHDEIGQLAAAFLFMNDKLRENITRLMQETTRRGRIESELSIAHDIQFGLLPFPLETEARKYVNIAAAMTPSKEVGGDLYDYFLLSDKKTLCYVIGDVSGKGVPAALFMAITRTLVRSTAEVETDPGRLLAAVNNRISENNPNLMFVTLLVGMLNIETGEFIWANAGHPPPFLISRGGAELLPGRSGPACGVMENISYRTFAHRFSPGETLFGYTDGVTEAFDTVGAQYGEARLKAALTHDGNHDAETTLSHVKNDIKTFTAGAEQSDDITLLAVCFL
jgi:sigma-B regulation protein RsbU (phosphoserine phosphatase)